MTQDFKYLLALSKVRGLGVVNLKRLIARFETAAQVWSEVPKLAAKEVELQPKVFEGICAGINWVDLNKELDFIADNDIQCASFMDENYPRRLHFCVDAPSHLFFKGNVELNHPKTLAIVGTRKATAHGKQMVKEIVAGLADQNVQIISGLAFGIDIVAHNAALDNSLSTLGMLAHGLDRIYPTEHTRTANEMLEKGGWITEHVSGTVPNAENFPKRNRIVAGMADAVLVIESQLKGGSMITADLAFSYGRDVFAIPGRAHDAQSKGCNFLIRSNKATLIDDAGQLKHAMNWRDVPKPQQIQKQLFVSLTPTEQQLVDFLKLHPQITVDELALNCNLTVSQVAAPLLNLELNGMVRSLPGKRVELV